MEKVLETIVNRSRIELEETRKRIPSVMPSPRR